MSLSHQTALADAGKDVGMLAMRRRALRQQEGAIECYMTTAEQ